MLKESAKLLLIKLKIISTSGKTYPYYLITAAIIAAFYNYYFIVMVLFLLYKFRLIIKYKLIIVISVILLLSFSVSIIKDNMETKQVIRGTIVEINANEYIIKSGFKKYLVVTNDKFEIGDVIELTGDSKPFSEVRVPHGFNEKKYHLSRNVYAKYNKPIIEKSGFNYLYLLNNLFYQYLSIFDDNTKLYLISMITGNNNFELNFKEASKQLQISYLLGLSGIFIYAALSILKKIFYYLDIMTETQDKLIFSFLFGWAFLVGFKMVILRILIINTITNISKNYGFKLTRLDIIFYSFLIILIINFNYIYSIGFILSFLVLTVISLSSNLLNRYHFFVNRYLSYFLIYLFIFPLLITMNNNLYLLIFFVTPVLVILFQKILSYSFIVVLIIPFLSPLTKYLLIYFEKFIIFLSQASLVIVIPSFSKVLIFLYYFTLVMIATATRYQLKNRLVLLLIIMLSLYNKAYLNIGYRLYFLDVSQGDTTIFITPNQKQVVVIDAYGDVLGVLNRLGIRKIDYLILTHPDNDHIGKADLLIDGLTVKKVIINPYDSYEINHENILTYQDGDIIYDQHFKIEFYGPIKNYYNTNDNSLVFKLSYLDNSVLFLGDISTTVEREIAKKYGLMLRSNILKLAHHGSNTSTSMELLKVVEPREIIISLGLNNIYGFPHPDVIEKISGKYNVYRTDLNYTIYYYQDEIGIKRLKYYQKK